MQKLGDIEILASSCNPLTVLDGRGGIFTWIPQDSIKEFNLIYYNPGKVRGNHFHPECVEYLLLVDGNAAIVTKDPKTGSKLVMHASKGTCIRIPKNISHAVYPITPMTAVAMLTKPWDSCLKPIVHETLIPRDKKAKKNGKPLKKSKR